MDMPPHEDRYGLPLLTEHGEIAVIRPVTRLEITSVMGCLGGG